MPVNSGGYTEKELLHMIRQRVPRDQAELITDYCVAHGYYCIDYYSIDSHAMNDAY